MSSFGWRATLGRGLGRMGSGGKATAVVIPGVITAVKGTYTVTGYDVNLAYSRLPLTAALGTYSVTGVDATLTYSGAGSLTGQPVGLLLALTYS